MDLKKGWRHPPRDRERYLYCFIISFGVTARVIRDHGPIPSPKAFESTRPKMSLYPSPPENAKGNDKNEGFVDLRKAMEDEDDDE